MLVSSLAAALLVNCKEAMTMHTKADASAETVQDLMQKLQAARMSIPGLPREAALGYPVPMVANGDTILAAPLYLRRGHPPGPPALSAPGWIAYIDDSGEQFTYRKLNNDLSATLGSHKVEPPLNMAEFRAAEARMYAALDRLLPLAHSNAPGVPPELQEEANVFASLWRQLAHRPLAAHYRAINPAWFARFGL